jgi:PAS domain S-box-containing protein
LIRLAADWHGLWQSRPLRHSSRVAMPPFGAAFFVAAFPVLLRSGRGSNPAESRFGDEAPGSNAREHRDHPLIRLAADWHGLWQSRPLRHSSRVAMPPFGAAFLRVRFSNLEENLPIAALRVNGEYLHHNLAAEMVCGWQGTSLRTIDGRFENFHGADRDAACQRYEQLRQNRFSHCLSECIRGVRMDGTSFPIDLVVSSVDHLGIFCDITRDISERRELEERVIHAVVDERRRSARDLHEIPRSMLTAIHLRINSLAKFRGYVSGGHQWSGNRCPAARRYPGCPSRSR